MRLTRPLALWASSEVLTEITRQKEFMAEDTQIQNRSNEDGETIASHGETDLEKGASGKAENSDSRQQISEYQREAEAAIVFGKG